MEIQCAHPGHPTVPPPKFSKQRSIDSAQSQDVAAVKIYVTSMESTTLHFLLQAKESKIQRLLRDGHLLSFCFPSRIVLLTSASRALTSVLLCNACITGMFGVNSTLPWEPEPAFAVFLRILSEIQSCLSVHGKVLRAAKMPSS